MSESLKEFEQIDAFLTVAKTIDTFQHCHTVYDLFGIKSKNAPYPDIERSIEEFVKKYAGNNAPKFKNFGKTISGEAERVKRVLKDHRAEYNDYLRKSDPRVKQLRQHFDFCTKRDGLDSKEKSDLIEEGKEKGLTETEVRSLIAQWILETGIKEVEDRSDDSTHGTPFPNFAGKTFYEILGVADNAEYAEIKDAYEREHVKYNTSREKVKASARFFVVSEAWDCLKDPVKRREYDEKLKQPKTPPPTGKPRLVVERKADYTFKDVRRGAVISIDKIMIKNTEGGLLQGNINSDVPWLEPDRNKVLEKHEQELYVNILTSKIPVNTYDTQGTITIDTNGGSPYSIPFRVIFEGLEIAADRFRKTYVPLAAACAGFLGSFSSSPFSNFLAGVFIIGIIAYAFARQFVNVSLNKGIDIFKFPPIVIQGAAAGVVLLTIMSHSGSGSPRVPSYTPPPTRAYVPPPPPTPTPAPAPVPNKGWIDLTTTVIAKGVDADQIPFGVGTNVPSGNSRLYYYISYREMSVDSATLVFKWYKLGSQIGENQSTLTKPIGNVWSELDYDFQPGQYEVRAYANDQLLVRTEFTVNGSVADTQKADEQQRQQAAERQRQQYENQAKQWATDRERSVAEYRQRQQAPLTQRSSFQPPSKSADAEPPKSPRVIIEMAAGKIVAELYDKDAPGTVVNFVKLTKQGFYNGLSFHRVVPGFVVQGGDPVGNGTGGPGYTIKDEVNTHKHLTGTVAMAKTSAPNSAGSQFYITLAPQPRLDSGYTVFGQVLEGMDIVMKIKQGDVMKKVTIVEAAESLRDE